MEAGGGGPALRECGYRTVLVLFYKIWKSRNVLNPTILIRDRLTEYLPHFHLQDVVDCTKRNNT